MRACFPHNQFQSSTTVSVYGGVEVYKERSFCVKYRSQGVQTSFYESTPSASGSLGNTIGKSDKPVFNTPAFRPCSPCYPTQAVAEPIVSHIRNPYLTFPGGVHHFHRRPDPGALTWGILRLRVYGPIPNASSTSMYWSSGR